MTKKKIMNKANWEKIHVEDYSISIVFIGLDKKFDHQAQKLGVLNIINSHVELQANFEGNILH